MKILVTGGCGYIGSHTIVDLIENSFEVISVDNYSNSSPDILDNIFELTGKRIKNYNLDLTDLNSCKVIFEENTDILGIIHFAAYKYVGESVDDPLKYYGNNLNSLMNMLACQREWNIPHFVFSSSCSVYGNPDVLPVDELTPLKEVESPYAATKKIGEEVIRDFYKANNDLNFILLRYFNPAGMHSSGKLRELPKKEIETLVPIIEEVHRGKRDHLTIFGGDYPTRDGTCIRDYIYIEDLAEAHRLAISSLEKSEKKGSLEIYNVGTGNGITVKEMVLAMEKVSGEKLNYSIGPRRSGDIVQVFADYSKAKNNLGWNPKRNIEDIFKSIM